MSLARKILLGLLTALLAFAVVFLVWFYSSPKDYWRKRHGKLAAITFSEPDLSGPSTIRGLRAISTSGLEAEVEFLLPDDASPSEARSLTPPPPLDRPRVKAAPLHLFLAIEGEQLASASTRFEPLPEFEAVRAVLSCPLHGVRPGTLARRSAALDLAPTVALALDALERVLLEELERPIGSVHVVVSGEASKLAASLLAFEPRLSLAVADDGIAIQNFDDWLVGGGALATSQFEATLRPLGQADSPEEGNFLNTNSQRGWERVERVLHELASPKAGD